PSTWGSFAISSRSDAAIVAGSASSRSRTAGTTPSACSISTRSKCSTSSWGWPPPSASCCASAIASWARWVNRSIRMSVAPSLGPGIRLRVVRQQRSNLVSGLLVEMRQHDAYPNDQVAAAAIASRLGQSLAGHVDLLAVLGVGTDPQLERAGGGLDGNLGTGDRLEERDRQLRTQISPVAFEAWIGPHVDRHVQVSGRRAGVLAEARATQLDASSVAHPWRNLDLQATAIHVNHAL